MPDRERHRGIRHLSIYKVYIQERTLARRVSWSSLASPPSGRRTYWRMQDANHYSPARGSDNQQILISEDYSDSQCQTIHPLTVEARILVHKKGAPI